MQITGIILGTGAPNQCSDGHKTKCAILLSDDLGLIRVYPIPAEKPFPVWGIVECYISRNSKDSRRESYKIAPDFQLTGKIENPNQKRKLLNECSLRSGGVDPIKYQNESRSSIAIVKQDFGDLMASMTQRVPDFGKDDPEFGWVNTQASSACKPYILWRSEQGKNHTSHLVGAEVYEGLRKNAENPFNIYNNMQVMNPAYERWLLLGNMRDCRNVWVVVHLHRLKKQPETSLLPFIDLEDGKPDGWPYSMQEAANERATSSQLELFAA